MIYLTRHGETEFNVARRLQGQCDSPLTARGLDQARLMGLALRELIDPADVTIFSSPLGRTRQTAQIIADAAAIGREIVFDPDLMEIGMGSWDGLTEFEIDAEWPGGRAGASRWDWFFRSPDGETHPVLMQRVAAALSRISNCPSGTRIVVSHGVTGRVMRGLYAGLDKDEALRLDAPHDAVFRLANQAVERIATGKHEMLP